MADMFTPSWEDVVSPERADLVFANRQKDYGAFQLRKNYQRTVAKAMIASIVFFTLCVSAPVIIRLIQGSIADNSTKPVEVEVT